MHGLRAGMPVTLELDGHGSLRCVVTALSDQTATLVQTHVADPQVADGLARGRHAYLMYTQPAGPIGLRGAALVDPESAAFIHFTIDPSR